MPKSLFPPEVRLVAMEFLKHSRPGALAATAVIEISLTPGPADPFQLRLAVQGQSFEELGIQARERLAHVSARLLRSVESLPDGWPSDNGS
jgi:hypothetical protein